MDATGLTLALGAVALLAWVLAPPRQHRHPDPSVDEATQTRAIRADSRTRR